MFGAGGGTSSYEELRESADLIVLWGSNAREAHPIFFHHVLKAVHRGAKLIVVDPRRTVSAEWADLWVGLDVGSDIPLANAIAREIIESGLANEEFISRATVDFDAFRESVEPWTLDAAEQATGVPAEAIRELAHAWGNAESPQICWTLGITEHHNGVDNVFALINLSLLVGGVGRYGAGLQPLRGQNNVQGGGDMGAIPNKLPGFQDVEDAEARAKFDAAWGATVPPKKGLHLTEMFEAMEHGDLRALYVVGENPAQSEADQIRARQAAERGRPPRRPGHLPDEDRRARRRRPAGMRRLGGVGGDGHLERAPGAACAEGARPAGRGARRHRDRVRAREAPRHRSRQHAAGGHLGRGAGTVADARRHDLRTARRAGRDPVAVLGRAAPRRPVPARAPLGRRRCGARPFMPVKHSPPVDLLDDDFPLRLTTGRRLESFNTGVQTGGFDSPLHTGGEALLVSPEDGERYGLVDGGRALVTSRRGSVEAPVAFASNLRPGLAFMNLHFPDLVETNVLTIDATDPLSGTAEFKATAIRVESV